MVKFEFNQEDEYIGSRSVIIQESDDDSITEIVDTFVRFLGAISFPMISIRDALLKEAIEIEQDIKENAIMIDDSED
jgi:hypothetical protein